MVFFIFLSHRRNIWIYLPTILSWPAHGPWAKISWSQFLLYNHIQLKGRFLPANQLNWFCLIPKVSKWTNKVHLLVLQLDRDQLNFHLIRRLSFFKHMFLFLLLILCLSFPMQMSLLLLQKILHIGCSVCICS